jgi:ribonuclease HI
MPDKLVIYTDGGARGNPGPAAVGVVFGTPSPSSGHALITSRKSTQQYSEAIGRTTNNVAEYRAVIFALKKAKSLLGGKTAKEIEVEIRSDSELVVSQLRGEYKIKEENLKPLFLEAWNLKQDFKSVIFTLIPREENKLADKLVNRALDTLL